MNGSDHRIPTVRRLRIPHIAIGLLAGLTICVPQSRAETPPSPPEPEKRRPLKTKVPVYPEKALAERRQGTVVVCFAVDSKGKVVDPYVFASTAAVFEKPALKAARASRYRPAAAEAADARSDICRTFRFALESAGTS